MTTSGDCNLAIDSIGENHPRGRTGTVQRR